MNWEKMGVLALIIAAACIYATISVWLEEKGVPMWVMIGFVFLAAIIAVGMV